MNRFRAIVVSVAVAGAAIAAVLALTDTLSLSGQARASSDREVTERTAQLDRYEASLRQMLARTSPVLPPLQGSTASVPDAVQHSYQDDDRFEHDDGDDDAHEHDDRDEGADQSEHDDRHEHEQSESDD